MNPFDDRFNRELLESARRNRDLFETETFKQAQRARELLYEPAIQSALEFQRSHGHLFDYWNKFVSSNELKLVRQFEDLRHGPAILQATALSATTDFLTHDLVARRIMNLDIWRTSVEVERLQRDAFSSTTLAAAKAVSEVTQFIQNNAFNQYFPQSFSAEILNALSNIDEPIDEESFEEFKIGLERVLSLIVEKCRELAVDPTTYWAMIKFAFTVFMFLYPLYDNHQTEIRITNSVNNTRIEILKEIEKLKPEEVTDTFYVVQRTARVKGAPRPKSKIIQILAPNQNIKLIDAKGKWIKIEFFDYIEGRLKTGWILKKYAERISNSGYKHGLRDTSSMASQVHVSETALLSEEALAEDWNRPEEDEAWSHLQSVP